MARPASTGETPVRGRAVWRRAGIAWLVLVGPPASLAPAQEKEYWREPIRLLEAGRPGKALEALDGVKDKVPEGSRWHWWELRGTALLDLSRDGQALEALNQAIALRPGCLGREVRAAVHVRAGRYAEALADLEACTDVKTGKEKSWRTEPLRFAISGPFRERWPHAARKLELRTEEGHYDLISNLGLTGEQMDLIERDASLLDSSKPAEKRKLDTLLRPAPELQQLGVLLETIRREMLPALNLSAKDWPAGRVLRVMVFRDEADLKDWRGRLWGYRSRGWLDDEANTLVTFRDDARLTSTGLGEGTVDGLVYLSASQLFSVYAPDSPWWLTGSIGAFASEFRLSGRGRQIKLELGLLKRKDPAGRPTPFECVKKMVESWSHVPWRRFFRSTNEWWGANLTFPTTSQGWGMCYYLFRGPDAEFRRRFGAFLADLRAGEDYDAALSKNLPDAALDKLEETWVAYWKGM
ncbi:MAG: hypothetical protein L0216_01945 [Planctomycetales bacterium]|nr:hypothetical protein [Planctomycetales bacterium]